MIVPSNAPLYGVTELITAINSELYSSLGDIRVQGELSNFESRPPHYYFYLKEQDSTIHCKWFSRHVQDDMLPLLKQGTQIIACGYLDVFKNGRLSLLVTSINAILDQQGEQARKRELLYLKLENAGYFSTTHKKKIPVYPERIGILTSTDSAAYHDVMQTMVNRYPLIEVVTMDARVQGSEAVSQLIKGLKTLDADRSIDTILLVRGGGSKEDLIAFDDESLVKTIFDLETPIITGIGHEIDVSFADLAADYQARTPTDAAIHAVPDKDDLLQLLSSSRSRCVTAYINIFSDKQHQLKELKRLAKSLSPLRPLKQGYALVYTANGELVRSIASVHRYDVLKVQVADGSFAATVNER